MTLDSRSDSKSDSESNVVSFVEVGAAWIPVSSKSGWGVGDVVADCCSLCLSKNDCPERIHITCAQQNGCTIEIVDKKGKIDFRAYCMEHQPMKPSKSKRRVSSKFLQEIAAQKENGNAKTNNQKSSNSNADWILNASSMISKNTEVQNTVSQTMNENNKRLVVYSIQNTMQLCSAYEVLMDFNEYSNKLTILLSNQAYFSTHF